MSEPSQLFGGIQWVPMVGALNVGAHHSHIGSWID